MIGHISTFKINLCLGAVRWAEMSPWLLILLCGSGSVFITINTKNATLKYFDKV